MEQGTPSAAAARLRLNLRHLEVFVATARGGSTRAAAERIARSQSAASTALADLEAALGVVLFDRVGRRLVLNENGRALLPRAASLLDQAGELQHLFSGDHATPLRVAASLTIGEYILPELVGQWKTRHPASPVRLVIANTTEVIAAVAAFDVDVGFIEGPQTHPDLIVRPWLNDEMVIVAAPTHPLAGRPVGLRMLREASWALRETGSGTREAADRWLLEHLGEIDVGFELGSPEAIKRLVAAGTALGCLSRQAVAQALAQGTLVELRTRLPPAVRRLAMVLHRDKQLGRGAQDFVSQCAAFRRERPPPAAVPRGRALL
ncbi:LysR family transcriptional regulator [Variovorax sp. M-6]|uniref:LysR family transcriptional regulator n=1 Tax=Variovorax sp. M-6 TaxID=3233041 RepID=UPI003F94811C